MRAGLDALFACFAHAASASWAKKVQKRQSLLDRVVAAHRVIALALLRNGGNSHAVATGGSKQKHPQAPCFTVGADAKHIFVGQTCRLQVLPEFHVLNSPSQSPESFLHPPQIPRHNVLCRFHLGLEAACIFQSFAKVVNAIVDWPDPPMGRALSSHVHNDWATCMFFMFCKGTRTCILRPRYCVGTSFARRCALAVERHGLSSAC